jgi:hypothetical protein
VVIWLLSVSTTLLYGMATDERAHHQAADFLHSCRPVARTTTYFIYDFREDPDAAEHVGTSGQPTAA